MTGVWKDLESFREIFPIKPASMLPKLPQSYLTLCNPMDCTLPGSSAHGILRARILEWFPISFSGRSSQPRDWTCISWFSCIGRQVLYHYEASSVQSVSRVRTFVIPWPAACQSSLSITNSQSLLKLLSIELVMPSNHLILCCRLLLPPSVFSSIRVFSSEWVLHVRWPKYWSFSFSIILPMNIKDWFHLGWTGWISLLSKGLLRVFSNTRVQKHQFFGAQLSL